MPPFVFFFTLLYPFDWVNDPGSPVAAAAGGTVLIRARALARVGGLPAMRGALIDDVTLARRIKRGGRVWLGHSRLATSIRPYETAADVWRMVARCAYVQLGHSPWLLAGTVAGMALVWLAPMALALFGGGLTQFLGVSAWGAMTASYIPTLRRFRLNLCWAVCLPAGRPVLHGGHAGVGGGPLSGAWGGVEAAGVLPMNTALVSGALAEDVESWSGKSRSQENFPVGSVLIRPGLRRHVHAFYDFARNADDIADSPTLAAADKIARLDTMEAVLMGQRDGGSPSAAALRTSLAATGVDAVHSRDLLRAFRQDAEKQRYASWAELFTYCRYSAMPVGRHVLALHGEGMDTVSPSDSLCAVLQVLNHLQDMARDFSALDRCYLPADWLAQAGSYVGDLSKPAETAGLRETKLRLLDECDRLNDAARALPCRVQDRRLRLETAVIVNLSHRLARRLRADDPLAARVKLRPVDVVLSVAASGRYLA